MNTMDGPADAAARDERAELLDAAVRVVKRDGPEALSIDSAAVEAQLDGARARQLFGDTTGFVLALHQHHLDTLLRHISAAIAPLGPGLPRLRMGIARFLDVSLRRVRMRTALRHLKAAVPAVEAQFDHRHRAFSHMLATELAASGWSRPIESARLLRVMVEAIALAELQARHELPELRAALWAYLSGQHA